MSIPGRYVGAETVSGSTAIPSVLRVDEVFKIYKDGPLETVALRGVSLEVQQGELVAMLGRSGSGKSTLLNVISGLDVPSAGRIWLAGAELTNIDGETRSALRRKHLGLVLQSGNLIPFLSARENVELPQLLDGETTKNARRRANELLDLVGLGARATHRVAELSGGEAQRVAIAGALANRPALVLADELTGELDSRTAQGILNLLHSVRHEHSTTFLIITHDREVAERADRVVRIEDGVIHNAAE